MSQDSFYIARCLELALMGAGHVSPNPMVGALLVHNDRIIGEGYHEQYGKAHAEVNCINSVSLENRSLIKDSTLYVSLEPCSHVGKTPPCTNLILTHKIRKVVVACKDISAKVNGKGIQQLKEAGVEVIEHVLEDEAIEINKRFFTFHKKHRPYLILKWAQSREGFIGNHEAQVKLSNTSTDQLVHQWRAEEDGIWVGYQTAQVDNPHLNVRLVEGQHPVRIVYDRDLSLNPTLHLFDQTQATFIFNHSLSKSEGRIEWIKLDQENPIKQLLNKLYEKNILSIMVEGGSKLLQQLIDMNLWDEIRCIETNTSLKEGIEAPRLNHLRAKSSTNSGDDIIKLYRNSDS